MTWLVVSILFLCLIYYIGITASAVDWGGRRINWIDGFGRLLCKYLHRLPDDKIPLPETGGALVVANHMSGLDPFLLLAACKRPIRFLIAREEYERPILNWLFKASGCIPVERSGKAEFALRQALKALQEGEVLAVFPHGKIHLDSDPPRKLKGGVTRLAAWSGVPIFPVRIDGVGGEGKTTLAPLIPSHVQLTMGKAFVCEPDNVVESLELIAQVIEKKP